MTAAPATEAATTAVGTEAVVTPPPPRPRPQATTVRITVRNGEPVGGIQRPKVQLGKTLTLIVEADVADEVHVHGYDVKRDVAPGEPARLQFRTDLAGRFEIELEDAQVQIAQLTVG